MTIAPPSLMWQTVELLWTVPIRLLMAVIHHCVPHKRSKGQGVEPLKISARMIRLASDWVTFLLYPSLTLWGE